jgi:hypothetical protein
MPYHPPAGQFIEDPPLSDLGPCMLACTPLQRRFVIALCILGTDDHSKAAAYAGSTANAETTSLSVVASQLWRNENVQKALHEENIKRLQSGQAIAVSTLIQLSARGLKEETRLKASVAILNRTGLHEVSEHKVMTQDVSKTDEAMIARIRQLIAKNPDNEKLVPPQLLAIVKAQPAPIDAEFEVVKDPDADLGL